MMKFTKVVIGKVIFALITIVIFNSKINATTITSAVTGTWSSAGTWVGGVVPLATDSVIIAASTNVTIATTVTVKQLTVNNDGYLTILSAKTLTITGGNLKVDGLINGAGALSLNTAGFVLSGSGSIENTGTFKALQNVTIPSTATLIKSGSGITINNNIIVTNNGSLTVYGAISGASGATNAQFVNAANAYLSVGTTLMNTGLLDATAIGNTVDYSSTGTQTIKATTYYHLSLSGAGQKRIAAVIDINGDLTCTAPFNPQNNNFTLAGSFTNSKTFSYGTGTVTLDGTADQDLTLTIAAAQSFYNLVINKSSGIVNVESNIIARNALTMTSGNIDNTGYTITLGTSTTLRGTLNYTSGTIIGSFERWYATTSTATNFLYPVGTLSNYRPVNITFTSIGTAGRLAYKFSETPPGNTGLPVTSAGVTSYNNFNDGKWIATGTTLVSTNYSLTLDGDGFTAFPFTANSRILTNTSGNWLAIGVHGSQVNSVLSRTGISGVTASFAIASDNNCTLPDLVTISGTSLPCKNSTVTYSVPNNVGSTYAWTLPAGATISGASNLNSVDVVFGSATGSNAITVKETNACGQGPLVSEILNVGPVQPALIRGSSKVAEGDQGVVYYVDSIAGYSYTWSVSNGTIASGQSKGLITVDFANQGTSTLNVITLGCSAFAPTVTKNINVSKVLVSTDTTGNIDDPAVWQGAIVTTTANIMIDSGAVISVQSASTISTVAGLTINEGGTFVLNKNFTVSGNFVLNGTLNTNGFSLILSGVDKNIRGTGTVINAGTVSITGGNKSITSDAVLSFSGNLSVDVNSVSVTNNGDVTIQGDLTRSTSSTTRAWINAPNSSLTVNGNILLNTLSTGTNSSLTVGGNVSSSPFTTGASSTTSITGTTTTVTAGASATLNLVGNVTTYVAGINSVANFSGTLTTITATAVGNTINYIGASQLVKGPTYHHLNISGTGTATLGANTTVNGDFNINNAAIFDAQTRTLTLKGNFVVTSSAATPFVPSTGTVSFTGTKDQEITCPVVPTFNNVTINKASGNAKMNTNVNVSTTLTLTLGDVDLNGYTLDLSTTGSLASESETSRIKGTGSITASRTVDKNTTLNIAGLGATLKTPNTPANNLGSVSVVRSHKAFGSGPNETPSRSYDITPTNNTGLSTDLTLVYLEVERPSNQMSPTKLYRSTDGGATFAAVTAGTLTFDSTGNNVKLTAISSFSRWVPGGLTPPVTPLPVELTQFNAVRLQNTVSIHWTTTMERENAAFVIEKSVDGNNFEVLTTVAGVGTTNNTTNYHYEMLNAPESALFLRLKQFDLNGVFTYSKVITVAGSNELTYEGVVAKPEFSIFPNPVTSNEVFVKYNNVDKQTVVVQIYDASEKVHYTEEIDVEGDGVTKLYLVPSQTLTTGVYYLVIRTTSKVHTMKLVIE